MFFVFQIETIVNPFKSGMRTIKNMPDTLVGGKLDVIYRFDLFLFPKKKRVIFYLQVWQNFYWAKVRPKKPGSWMLLPYIWRFAFITTNNIFLCDFVFLYSMILLYIQGVHCCQTLFLDRWKYLLPLNIINICWIIVFVIK